MVNPIEALRADKHSIHEAFDMDSRDIALRRHSESSEEPLICSCHFPAADMLVHQPLMVRTSETRN